MPHVAAVRRLSLRTRLALLAAAGAMLVLSIGALLLYRDVSGELSRAITDELTVRADDLAASLDTEPITPAPSSVVAQVVTPSGQVLAPAGLAPVLTADELARAARGEVIVDRAIAGVGEHARLLAQPMRGPGGEEVVGVVATSTASLAEARRAPDHRARPRWSCAGGGDRRRGVVPDRCRAPTRTADEQRGGDDLDG